MSIARRRQMLEREHAPVSRSVVSAGVDQPILVDALLLEQNDGLAVQRGRYMTLKSLAQLSDDPAVTLPAMAK